MRSPELARTAGADPVAFRKDTGEVRLLRVTCPVDSGEVVSPDGVPARSAPVA